MWLQEPAESYKCHVSWWSDKCFVHWRFSFTPKGEMQKKTAKAAVAPGGGHMSPFDEQEGYSRPKCAFSLLPLRRCTSVCTKVAPRLFTTEVNPSSLSCGAFSDELIRSDLRSQLNQVTAWWPRASGCLWREGGGHSRTGMVINTLRCRPDVWQSKRLYWLTGNTVERIKEINRIW